MVEMLKHAIIIAAAFAFPPEAFACSSEPCAVDDGPKLACVGNDCIQVEQPVQVACAGSDCRQEEQPVQVACGTDDCRQEKEPVVAASCPDRSCH
jgi:hypothetical protein